MGQDGARNMGVEVRAGRFAVSDLWYQSADNLPAYMTSLRRDYLLTARFFRPEQELGRLRLTYELEHMAAEAILPMLEVHEDYLAVALRYIDQNFGSVEEYLARALGVGAAELAELRARYLE